MDIFHLPCKLSICFQFALCQKQLTTAWKDPFSPGVQLSLANEDHWQETGEREEVGVREFISSVLSLRGHQGWCVPRPEAIVLPVALSNSYSHSLQDPVTSPLLVPSFMGMVTAPPVASLTILVVSLTLVHSYFLKYPHWVPYLLPRTWSVQSYLFVTWKVAKTEQTLKIQTLKSETCRIESQLRNSDLERACLRPSYLLCKNNNSSTCFKNCCGVSMI